MLLARDNVGTRKDYTGTATLGDSMDPVARRPRWWEDGLLIILLIALCPPLGFLLVWTNRCWSRRAKLRVTAEALVIWFVVIAAIYFAQPPPRFQDMAR